MKLLSRDTLKYFSHQNLPRSLRKSEINFEQRSWLTHQAQSRIRRFFLSLPRNSQYFSPYPLKKIVSHQIFPGGSKNRNSIITFHTRLDVHLNIRIQSGQTKSKALKHIEYFILCCCHLPVHFCSPLVALWIAVHTQCTLLTWAGIP